MATGSSFVSVDEVIATAMSLTESADSVDRAYFKEWVYLGLKELGPNTSWVAYATLYPVDYQLEKPKNMASPIALGLYDSSGQELNYVLRGKGFRVHRSDNSLINDGTFAPAFGAPIDLSEDAYYYNLGTNSQDVSYAKLTYFKYPVDENDELIIPENNVLPLALFCKYMFYLRKDDKVGIGQFHNLWIAARNEARTSHKLPSMLEGAEIARSWNSMIQKMRFKKF